MCKDKNGFWIYFVFFLADDIYLGYFLNSQLRVRTTHPHIFLFVCWHKLLLYILQWMCHSGTGAKVLNMSKINFAFVCCMSCKKFHMSFEI